MSDQNMNTKIEELQALEGHLQGFLAQKQGVQIELNEIENAMAELKSSDGDVYKVISGVMLKSKKDVLSKELEEKKKMFEMRIGALEKQEKLLEKNAVDLRKEVNKSISESNK